MEPDPVRRHHRAVHQAEERRETYRLPQASDVSGIILHLRAYAQLAIDLGDHERALVLAGAVHALEDETGPHLREAFSEQLRGFDEMRAIVGVDRAQELIEEGRSMSRKQAVQYALSG